MFDERLTELARRVPFMAGIEARKLHSPQIESEHLLLALLRQDKAMLHRFLRSDHVLVSITRRIEERRPLGSNPSMPSSPPFSAECTLVFDYASEQSESLGHRHIGTEHLLLGLLQNANCVAARILAEYDLRFVWVRQMFEISNDNAADKHMRQVYCVKCQGFGKVGTDAAAGRSLWRVVLKLPQQFRWEMCPHCGGRGYTLMSPADYHTYEVAADNRIEEERRQSTERARRESIAKQEELNRLPLSPATRIANEFRITRKEGLTAVSKATADLILEKLSQAIVDKNWPLAARVTSNLLPHRAFDIAGVLARCCTNSEWLKGAAIIVDEILPVLDIGDLYLLCELPRYGEYVLERSQDAQTDEWTVTRSLRVDLRHIRRAAKDRILQGFTSEFDLYSARSDKDAGSGIILPPEKCSRTNVCVHKGHILAADDLYSINESVSPSIVLVTGSFPSDVKTRLAAINSSFLDSKQTAERSTLAFSIEAALLSAEAAGRDYLTSIDLLVALVTVNENDIVRAAFGIALTASDLIGDSASAVYSRELSRLQVFDPFTSSASLKVLVDHLMHAITWGMFVQIEENDPDWSANPNASSIYWSGRRFVAVSVDKAIWQRYTFCDMVNEWLSWIGYAFHSDFLSGNDVNGKHVFVVEVVLAEKLAITVLSGLDILSRADLWMSSYFERCEPTGRRRAEWSSILTLLKSRWEFDSKA